MSEECRTAFQASLELIKEKCGVSLTAGKTVKLEGLSATVKVPEEVEKIASSNPELTREERIKAVSETNWARRWGRGMCEMVSPELVGKEKELCIGRMAKKLAEGTV